MEHRVILSAIDERLPEATARGLAQAVTVAIRDGLIVPGTRLPPIREVARELTLSPTTVAAGWRLLAASGLVRADGRRGTTVLDRAAPTRYRAAMDWQADLELDLSTGIPDVALLPTLDQLSLPSALPPRGYLSPSVLPELAELVRADWPYPVAQSAVVDGAMDGLDLLVRTHVGFGDRVVIEHPAYSPIVDLLESVGAEIVALPMDADGVLAGDLARALTGPVAAVVLQPTAHNPTGVSLTPGRAEQLSRLLARSGALVVEDDSAGALAVGEPVSLGRWLPDRVVRVRSFSKSHGPDLRLAVLGGPADVLARVEARRRLGQGWTSRLLQHLLVQLLTSPAAQATVARARKTYAARRQALIDGLAAGGVAVGGTEGLNVWVPVADEAGALVRLARDGIGVAPGSAFTLEPGHPAHVRVTSGLLDEARAPQVAAALVAAAAPPARASIVR